MMLEDIARMYGMTDYIDMNTGRIYQLSSPIKNEDGTLLIPVKDNYSKQLVGYAKMSAVE